jgi:ribonuclease HI
MTDIGIWEEGQGPQARLDIYTDGSATNNGRAGASAGVGVYFGPGDMRNVSTRCRGEQTNQNAELQALHIAVSLAAYELSNDPNLQINILTDSAYSIKCVTEWYGNWVRNGWRTASGSAVKHREWIEPTANMLKRKPQIKLVKVKGHSGNTGNEMADLLARNGGAQEVAARHESAQAPPLPRRKFVYMGTKRVKLVSRDELDESDGYE